MRTLLLVTLFLLSACGGSQSEVTLRDRTPITVSPAEDDTGATTIPGSTTTSVVDRTPRSVGPDHFALPSRNVSCTLSDVAARCDIGTRNFQFPPDPGNCESDYGSGLNFGPSGKAEVNCVSDAVHDSEIPALPYGESAQRGTIRCDSAESGVTCRQLLTGNGFFLSRGSYRTF